MAQFAGVSLRAVIVAGMLVQASALAALALSGGRVAIATATAALLGLGTAMVHPTLIAAMSDAVSPIARAPVVGVYRFWRDMGYALGALIAGTVADALGYGGAIAIVAGLTAASGLWVLRDMPTERRGGVSSVPPVISMQSFGGDLAPYPRVMRVHDRVMAIAAFADAHPAKQPDAE